MSSSRPPARRSSSWPAPWSGDRTSWARLASFLTGNDAARSPERCNVHDVSTRSGEDLVTALGGTGISKSEISGICAGLDEAVGAFRTRALGPLTACVYVYVDATYLDVRTTAAMVVSKRS